MAPVLLYPLVPCRFALLRFFVRPHLSRLRSPAPALPGFPHVPFLASSTLLFTSASLSFTRTVYAHSSPSRARFFLSGCPAPPRNFRSARTSFITQGFHPIPSPFRRGFRPSSTSPSASTSFCGWDGLSFRPPAHPFSVRTLFLGAVSGLLPLAPGRWTSFPLTPSFLARPRFTHFLRSASLRPPYSAALARFFLVAALTFFLPAHPVPLPAPPVPSPHRPAHRLSTPAYYSVILAYARTAPPTPVHLPGSFLVGPVLFLVCLYCLVCAAQGVLPLPLRQTPSTCSAARPPSSLATLANRSLLPSCFPSPRSILFALSCCATVSFALFFVALTYVMCWAGRQARPSLRFWRRPLLPCATPHLSLLTVAHAPRPGTRAFPALFASLVIFAPTRTGLSAPFASRAHALSSLGLGCFPFTVSHPLCWSPLSFSAGCFLVLSLVVRQSTCGTVVRPPLDLVWCRPSSFARLSTWGLPVCVWLVVWLSSLPPLFPPPASSTPSSTPPFSLLALP